MNQTRQKPRTCRMDREHMRRVLAIESKSFAKPWERENFIECLRQPNCTGTVAESDGHVVGYMVYELHRRSISLLNFAVHPDFRRQGVGELLFGKLTTKLSARRRNRIAFYVSERNLPGHLFFQQMGCVAIDVDRYFYHSSDEFAYRFIYRVEESQSSCSAGPR